MSGCCPPRRPASPQTTTVAPAVAGSSTRSAPERDADELTRGMVAIPAGGFRMGADDAEVIPGDGEGPIREVILSAYRIDARAVTNAQFAVFVEDTGYVTEAERIGWSFVFAGLLADSARGAVLDARLPDAPWWLGVREARWSAPDGPGSDITARGHHPVVHVSFNDAVAYAGWAGKRLPTEAEWERAARGGLEGRRMPWGDALEPSGQQRCNIWRGTFPTHHDLGARFAGTMPVGAFRPNRLGLYNTSGNVWEWCRDRFSADWHAPASPATRVDPQGPSEGSERVMRGGSYLCHASYCNRYRVSARTANTPDAASGHLGFRCALDEAAVA